MAFRALLKHDLDGLMRSWLVRFWFVAAGVWTLLVLAGCWATVQSAIFVGWILFPFLVLPWFLIVLGLGIRPVTGTRAEALADSILCRPVTRIEYLAAAWAARVAAVLAVYLLVTIPAILLVVFVKRPAPADEVTLYGVLATFAVVALVQTFQVTVGFLFGTMFRSTILSLIVLVFAWLPILLIPTALSLEEFSPITLNQSLPTLLRTPWRLSDNEPPTADLPHLENMDDMGAQFLAVLSGTSPPPRREPDPEFFDQTRFEDFSLPRVALGYGIPTLLSMALATMFFCARDF